MEVEIQPGPEIIDPGGTNVERPVENLVQLYKPTVLKTNGFEQI